MQKGWSWTQLWLRWQASFERWNSGARARNILRDCFCKHFFHLFTAVVEIKSALLATMCKKNKLRDQGSGTVARNMFFTASPAYECKSCRTRVKQISDYLTFLQFFKKPNQSVFVNWLQPAGPQNLEAYIRENIWMLDLFQSTACFSCKIL